MGNMSANPCWDMQKYFIIYLVPQIQHLVTVFQKPFNLYGTGDHLKTYKTLGYPVGKHL